MKYAPVLIPTLNRFEHFKQCIESLSDCSWAEFTEVYVALDFPAKNSHWEGYNKTKEYLDKCGNLNFKELHVIKRPYNYGISYQSGHVSNLGDLIEIISSRYDRYILSEDDNVFSPNFLEYIDKGLEEYEDDDSVYAIVGYCHPYPFKRGDNNFFRHQTDFSAWGYGIWVSKKQKAKALYEGSLFKGFPSLMKIKSMKVYGYNRLLFFLNQYVNSKHNFTTDTSYSAYLQATGKTVIVPVLSKVRNTGWDGSGNSGAVVSNSRERIAKGHMGQIIDNETHFDYIGSGWDFFDENNRIAARYSDGRINFWKFTWLLSISCAKSIVKYIIRWDKCKK